MSSIEKFGHYNPREELVSILSTFSDKQWEAMSLCEGWDTRHVVAHLIVRERRPLASFGIIFSALSHLHDERVEEVAKAPTDKLLQKLSEGPPALLRIGDVHFAEDWIHTQDILRGEAMLVDPDNELEIDGGDFNPELEEKLWKACNRMAPLAFRKLGMQFRLHLTDGKGHDQTWLIRNMSLLALKAVKTHAKADVTVTGPVGELLLFLSGRVDAARVTFTGSPVLIEKLRKGIVPL